MAKSTTNTLIDQDQAPAPKEDLNMFLNKISCAQQEESEYIETTPEIIKSYNRKGLGKDAEGRDIEHFMFQGIKVYPYGKREEIEERINEPLSNRMHGKGEGRRLGSE